LLSIHKMTGNAVAASGGRESDFGIDKKISEAEITHHDAVPSADALQEALAHGNIDPWSKPMLQLYFYCVIAFLCSTMNG
jgi:hypothetical protein